MYNIEYAYLSETPPFVRRNNDGERFLNDNSEAILNYYDRLSKELIEIYIQEETKVLKLQKAWETKSCAVCGSQMKYISSHDFWSCTNYQSNNQRHTTFSGKEPIITIPYCIISVNWLTDMLRTLGIEKHVNTKELYNWLCIQNGREDLYLKYSGIPSTKRIDGYVKTKIRSVKMELEAMKHLETLYSKVVYQQCITYKLADKKEAFCIPDFICSTPDVVHVIDAKLDCTNDNKMELYVSLVKHILNSKKDSRQVDGFHIMYNVSKWDKEHTKYGIIELK